MRLISCLLVLILAVSCGPRRPGRTGAAGAAGANGVDGLSLVLRSLTGTLPGYDGVCTQVEIFQDKDRDGLVSEGDGALQTSFVVCNGLNGEDGSDGEDGEDGLAGANGLSAYEFALEHGFEGDEEDWLASLKGETGAIGPQGPQGIQGVQGQAASTTYQVVQIIDPCGDAPNKVDEVILKLGNGQYLASFSDNSSGLNTRFGILSPGTYMTTDGTNCTFTLN